MAQLWIFPDGFCVSVNRHFYPASCDGCGWQGSSEHCGVDTGFEDSDVYCPRCHKPGADCGKTAEEAVKVRAGRAANLSHSMRRALQEAATGLSGLYHEFSNTSTVSALRRRGLIQSEGSPGWYKATDTGRAALKSTAAKEGEK